MYDPEDDELSESFQLERFLVVEFEDENENQAYSLIYIEFDQRYFIRGNEVGIANENKDILLRLCAREYGVIDFYLRVHEIKYDRSNSDLQD